MRYFKQYKEDGAVAIEIGKEEAKHNLEGWWKQDALDDIFGNEKEFRLYTPYVDVWTQNEQGLVPMPGFYGTVGGER